jgi:hypothetical protein
VIDIKVALHVFLMVLILGTVWRLSSFHLMASPNAALQHAGMAMSIQY